MLLSPCYICLHAESQREEEEDEHRSVEVDGHGDDYPWSISPPAKKSRAEGPGEEREERDKIHQDHHFGLQIQGAR